MESKETHRNRLINRVYEMVERSLGVVFHDIKALDGNDVTFMDAAGDIRITIETPNSRLGEEKEVAWKYLTDEALEEIVGIINESNQGVTY